MPLCAIALGAALIGGSISIPVQSAQPLVCPQPTKSQRSKRTKVESRYRPPTELETWNSSIEHQGWRVLWASNSQSALGMYMGSPLVTEARLRQPLLASCGVELISQTRRQFSSPPVPRRISIGTPESRNLSLGTEPLFESGLVRRLIISIYNPRWTRLKPPEITYKLRHSKNWSEPIGRQKIIRCLARLSRFPIVESVLQADIAVEARDSQGKRVDISGNISRLKSGSFLTGGLMSRSGKYTISGITMARRVALCTDSLLFFRNSNNQIGRDYCAPVSLNSDM